MKSIRDMIINGLTGHEYKVIDGFKKFGEPVAKRENRIRFFSP